MSGEVARRVSGGESRTQHLEVILEFGHKSTLRTGVEVGLDLCNCAFCICVIEYLCICVARARGSRRPPPTTGRSG